MAKTSPVRWWNIGRYEAECDAYDHDRSAQALPGNAWRVHVVSVDRDTGRIEAEIGVDLRRYIGRLYGRYVP